jgi:prepilin-type N-terminal cleavage/methylation domain-containing protein
MTSSKWVRRDRSEAGFTLVELIVAMAVLAGIVLPVSMVMLTTTVTLNASTIQGGSSSSAGELSVQELTKVLSSITTPTNSAAAAGGSPSASTPCWGTSAPVSTVGEAPPSAGAIASPGDDGIAWAHDFDLWFCGVWSMRSSTPRVFRLWIDPSTCTGTSPRSYCSLVLDDFGASGSGPASVRWSERGIWCDASCQSANEAPFAGVAGSGPGSTPPLFSYYGAAGSSSSVLATPIDDTSDTLGANLSDIRNVVVAFTALDGPDTKPGAPSATFRTQIFLPNTA